MFFVIAITSYVYCCNLLKFWFYLQTYRDSMCKLKLVTNGELEQIFGPLDEMIPIHEGKITHVLLIHMLFESHVIWITCYRKWI